MYRGLLDIDRRKKPATATSVFLCVWPILQLGESLRYPSLGFLLHTGSRSIEELFTSSAAADPGQPAYALLRYADSTDA